MVAKQSRCEGVYNRTGDLSVTCFGKEEQRNECEAIKKSPQAICSLRRRGWGGRIRQGKPCRLQQFYVPFASQKMDYRFESCQKAKQKTADAKMHLLFLAGVAGFEPTNTGIKIQCLTAWRHPNIKRRNGARDGVRTHDLRDHNPAL